MSKYQVKTDYVSYLLQAIKVLHVESDEINDLDVIYKFVISVDDVVLNEYINKATILTYKNDIFLFIEILNKMITIYESYEDYEKCGNLLMKKNKCLNLITNEKYI